MRVAMRRVQELRAELVSVLQKNKRESTSRGYLNLATERMTEILRREKNEK